MIFTTKYLPMATRGTIPIKTQTTQAPVLQSSVDPHVKLAELQMSAVLTNSKTTPPQKQKNLHDVTMNQITRRLKVALVVAPEWSPLAPPYGVARMSALAKHMGFATRVYDVNILCKHRGPTEYWTPYEDWKWIDPHYSEHVHPKIEPLLIEYAQDIAEWRPDVIGFSTWYTNDTCTVWMANRFRSLLPGVKIVMGGANATQMKITRPDVADHVISGEGEAWWVKLLENLDAGDEPLPHLLLQDREQRIDLDSMPPADYSDIDISLYDSGGISCEFSRGCIANCVYCNETVFWKFRSRQADRVLEEIETVYRQQKITAVWFIDSLLNGNLKQLKSFADGLIERDIRVGWTGYARVDGKMDLDFWQHLKSSGATGFAFGVESGSQKVLDLMKKNCRVANIEKNFRDLATIKLYNNFATWFTGFPGEELTDVAQTMTLMWRLRKSGMGAQSSATCGLGHNTPLDLERERFGVNARDWSWGWATQDLRNTVFHRFVRWKCANVLLENFRNHGCSNHDYMPHCQYPDLKNQYRLDYSNTDWSTDIPWEPDFDYDICKPGITVMADSLVNEIWPLLRVLWLGMGAYRLHLEFEPERDLREFGYLRYPRGGEHRYWATYDFDINVTGSWHAKFDIRLQADPGWENEPLDFHYQYDDTGEWSKSPMPDGIGDDEPAGDHMHHHPQSL